MTLEQAESVVRKIDCMIQNAPPEEQAALRETRTCFEKLALWKAKKAKKERLSCSTEQVSVRAAREVGTGSMIGSPSDVARTAGSTDDTSEYQNLLADRMEQLLSEEPDQQAAMTQITRLMQDNGILLCTPRRTSARDFVTDAIRENPDVYEQSLPLLMERN